MAVDNTAPAPADRRLRVVEYNAEQVILAYAKVGATFRIRLDPNERVVPGGLVVSDQATMNAATPQPPELCVDDTNKQVSCDGGARSQDDQSCDRNLCRSVVMNTVYIMPRTALQPQPLFLRTEWCPEPGKCQPREYAFELHTSEAEAAAAGVSTAFFGLQFRYSADETAYRVRVAAAERKARADAAEKWRRDNPPPALPSVPEAAARIELGKCASAPELAPDDAWTDGRTTFVAYNGSRRVPNVYEVSADGKETLTQYATEPEPARTVVRIGKVRAIFILRDGDRASCVVNPEADATNRTELAVAPIALPVAGQPRTRRRYP